MNPTYKTFGSLPKEEQETNLLSGYSDLLTVSDMAEITGQSKQTIRSLCHAGALPNLLIGKRIYVPKERFIAFINDACDKSLSVGAFRQWVNSVD